MKYFFYIVRCLDDSLYSGITTDLKRRVDEHNSDGKKGAKYLRAKKPVKLVYSEKFKDRNTALVREAEVKKLSKMNKELLIIKNHFKKTDKKIHSIMKGMDFEQWKKVIREEEDYFINLTRSIIGQQLSGKAASTIIGRFENLFPKKKINARLLLKISDEILRGVGMSYSKASFIKDLAKKTLSGEVSFKNINKLSDEDVISHLIKVKGIGPWTAEMFLMFSLARPNIFSHKDLGLNRAIQKLYGFKKPPTFKQVEKIIIKWEPFKSYASFALWESLDNS